MSARDALRRVLRGQTLGRDEARELLVAVAHDEASADEAVVRSALFAALATRGESIDELVGAAEALRATGRRFEHAFPDAIDFSGTGGDAFYTFNVTAAAGLVAASAGARVILQGERALATACASADLLEAAGLSLELEPEASAQVLEEVGITFLHSPIYHPALAATAGLRRALGVRTLLDLAAPLSHPAHLSRQIVGVGERVRAARVAAALGELGTERAFVVHGAGGADELTLAGENLVLRLGA
ncbi:MAG: anthranilate phosphoribosyltransferase, partial [Planctomycetes bacterium]|nr:anthranilate phosphoribosyltransferase [Planctomycetota bacterium]